MSYKIFLCVIFLNTYFCVADILADYTEKCSIRDGECQKNTLSSIMHEKGEIGIPELDVPPWEPYVVKDTTVSVLGMVFLTMTDGLVEGATNCSFVSFETNLDERYTDTESLCELIKISGNYEIKVGPLAQALFGNPVSGDGFGQIQIEKMTLKMKVPFSIEEFDDNEIYLVPNTDKAEYSTNNIEKIVFGANNIMLGHREISEELMTFMNNNWKTILKSFGRLFSDKVMETFYVHLKEFFMTFPASKLVRDDMSSYVES